jgi:hypothetical protein
MKISNLQHIDSATETEVQGGCKKCNYTTWGVGWAGVDVKNFFGNKYIQGQYNLPPYLTEQKP